MTRLICRIKNILNSGKIPNIAQLFSGQKGYYLGYYYPHTYV